MPLAGRRARDPVLPARSETSIDEGSPRVEVRSQHDLIRALAEGALPVLVAPTDYMIGSGALVESRGISRLHAVEDARVLAHDNATVSAADDVVITAYDDSTARLFGRAKAVLSDRAAGRAYPRTDQPFPDGSSHDTTGVEVDLGDLARLESWAPTTVRAVGESDLILHGTRFEMTASVGGSAKVAVLGEATVEAREDAFLYVASGRVRASDRVVIALNPFTDDRHAPPQVQATESAVVVSKAGLPSQGGRSMTLEQVSTPEGWLALWGLEPHDGQVDLLVGVRPADGMVMHDRWLRRAYLRAGDTLPEGLAVTTRRNMWPMGPSGVEFLTVRVPIHALRPDRQHIDSLGLAKAGTGVVVE